MMWRWAIIAAMVLAVGGLVYFFYPTSSAWQYQRPVPTTAELDLLVTKVARLTVLPADEAPTVITVADPSKLKPWPLFRESKVGDKVLVYQKSGKIILYDPAADKVVAVGVIN